MVFFFGRRGNLKNAILAVVEAVKAAVPVSICCYELLPINRRTFGWCAFSDRNGRRALTRGDAFVFNQGNGRKQPVGM